jgi:ribosomal protein L37AE/L43A
MPLTNAGAYAGPACPRCGRPLPSAPSGVTLCEHCGRPFEGTVFAAPQRRLQVMELHAAGPEGAGSCANHPGNAAVANCARCGIYICSLCEIEVAGGKYCPSCFDRLSTEGGMGSTQKRVRNFTGLASATALLGLFFAFLVGVPLGLGGLYYSSKALTQRRQQGESTWGIWILILVAIADIFLQGLLIFSLFMTTKK